MLSYWYFTARWRYFVFVPWCANEKRTRPVVECAPLAAKPGEKQGKFKPSYSTIYCGICSKNLVVNRREVAWTIIMLLWYCCGMLVAFVSRWKLGALSRWSARNRFFKHSRSVLAVTWGAHPTDKNPYSCVFLSRSSISYSWTRQL